MAYLSIRFSLRVAITSRTQPISCVFSLYSKNTKNHENQMRMAPSGFQILYISLPGPFWVWVLSHITKPREGSGSYGISQNQASLCISLYNENTQKCIEKVLPADLKYYEILCIYCRVWSLSHWHCSLMFPRLRSIDVMWVIDLHT